MTPQQLMDLLDYALLDTRAYSGRNMNGNTCPAFTIEHPIEMMGHALDIAWQAKDKDVPYETIRTALKRAEIDNMGKGWIVYFPRYTFETAK